MWRFVFRTFSKFRVLAPATALSLTFRPIEHCDPFQRLWGFYVLSIWFCLNAYLKRIFIYLFVLIRVPGVGIDGNFNILEMKLTVKQLNDEISWKKILCKGKEYAKKILVFQRSTELGIYQFVHFKQIRFNSFDFFAFDAEISRTLNTTYWLKTMATLTA